MVTTRRQKVRKCRSHTTHGGGHRKKRRGAGSRGGRGNAGTGKRAGQKKAGIQRKLGKHGFTTHSTAIRGKSINVSHFTTKKLDRLVEAKKVTKKGDLYVVDLKSLGYVKLLGTGSLSLKVEVTVPQWSQTALAKVKNAGGSIVGAQASDEGASTEA